MYVTKIHKHYRWTNGQTDGQTTCYRNSAPCVASRDENQSDDMFSRFDTKPAFYEEAGILYKCNKTQFITPVNGICFAAYRLNVDCCKSFITIFFIFAVVDVLLLIMLLN